MRGPQRKPDPESAMAINRRAMCRSPSKRAKVMHMHDCGFKIQNRCTALVLACACEQISASRHRTQTNNRLSSSLSLFLRVFIHLDTDTHWPHKLDTSRHFSKRSSMSNTREQDLYDNADAKVRYEAYRCEFSRYEAYRWAGHDVP